MADLALEEQLSGEVRLYDIDTEAARINETIGNRISQYEDAKSRWRYRAVSSLETALTNADFVIISIQPGTFREMESDVHLPEKFGIYQPVGDTVGPGGIIRALRTLPIYRGFAEAIRETAPEAWVINYTNPMTLCTRMLYEVFPGIKAFGCCHEVFGTQKLLASMLEDMLDIKGTRRDEINTNVLGINHFTWIDKASYKNRDLFPLFKDFADTYYKSGYEGLRPWTASVFASAHRVKFDLFKRYGLIAAAGDRHLAEFVPPWYVSSPDTPQEWKFHLTPVSWRINDMYAKQAQSERLANGEEEVELQPSGEEGVQQIKALVGLKNLTTNVNLPNYGQIENLPSLAVVETNALFSFNSVRPVLAGNLPRNVHTLVARHVYNQENLIQAVMRKDKEQIFNVFLNDPFMSRLCVHDARTLFEEMLSHTAAYLPEWIK
jgi:alpha-galactosidase